MFNLSKTASKTKYQRNLLFAAMLSFLWVGLVASAGRSRADFSNVTDHFIYLPVIAKAPIEGLDFLNIERISLGSSGEQGNGASSRPTISDNGRFVAFVSAASNLVEDDTNNEDDIFVYDRETGLITRVSVDSQGNEANRDSEFPSISSDGRFVAFASRASNLVEEDTNGESDIFVHDRETGETTRVSVDSDGNQGYDFGSGDGSEHPAISGNGRFVAFDSTFFNLTAEDGDYRGIFVHDRQTKETTLISIDHSGEGANAPSFYPDISNDGRYVAFYSIAKDLIPSKIAAPEDFNPEGGQLFIRDRQTSAISRITSDSNGEPGNNDSYLPSISGDGRFVTYETMATNLSDNDSNESLDILLYDSTTITTQRISVSNNGTEADSWSYLPKISNNGYFIVYHSYATNLVANDTNGMGDIFFYNIDKQYTQRLSRSNSGAEGNGRSQRATMSADGTVVVFESEASNLVGGDTNAQSDIFIVQLD